MKKDDDTPEAQAERLEKFQERQRKIGLSGKKSALEARVAERVAAWEASNKVHGNQKSGYKSRRGQRANPVPKAKAFVERRKAQASGAKEATEKEAETQNRPEEKPAQT